MGINGEWDEIWGSRHGGKWSEWNTDGEEGKQREGVRMKTGLGPQRCWEERRWQRNGWFCSDSYFSSCVFWLRSAGPAHLRGRRFMHIIQGRITSAPSRRKKENLNEYGDVFFSSVVTLNCWRCFRVTSQPCLALPNDVVVVCVHQRWVAAQRLAPLLHKSEPGGQMFLEEATKRLVYWAQRTGRGARGLHICPLLLDINIDQMSGSFGKTGKFN